MPEARSIFETEKRILEAARELLSEADEKGISTQDYEKLILAYADLLREIARLTRFSDRNDRKMRILTEKLRRYVSPPLFKKITTGKESVEINQTKRVKLSIFFSDIVDFSRHSHDLEGETLSTFLNSYLEEMTRIVNEHGGTLDKYIGDAIMVFFGDPVFVNEQDHALRCVKMAIAMQNKLTDLHIQWHELGFDSPLNVRMGISTGFVSVGNFGSSERLDYTIIGTPVNLAARIQSMAGEGKILISHATWALVKDEIPCTQAFGLGLKGFDKEQLVHEVILEENKDLKLIENQDLGLSLRWDKSKINLEELIKILEE